LYKSINEANPNVEVFMVLMNIQVNPLDTMMKIFKKLLIDRNNYITEEFKNVMELTKYKKIIGEEK